MNPFTMTSSINISKLLGRLMATLILILGVNTAQAVIGTYEFEQLDQREQFSRMNDVLRCPLCQNQSISESNAPIANDLRREVHRLITEEQASDREIIDFMLVRYGDFVLYKPPLDSRTIALWFGPVVLLLIGLLALIRLFRNINGSGGEEDMSDQEEEKLAEILDGKVS